MRVMHRLDWAGTDLAEITVRLEGQPTVFHVLPRGFSKDWHFPQKVDLGMALAGRDSVLRGR